MHDTNERAPTILFWAVATLLVLIALGAEALRGSEVRWAEISREMLLSGDYFHPTRNGVAYFDKPLLGYWFITLAAVLPGKFDETVVRLPSALAGLAALAATWSVARRIGTLRQARTACWILLTMWGFLLYSRTAEADAANLASIVLAVAWYWSRRDRPSFLSYLVFYAICFLGAQTKGMAAIAIPIVVVLTDAVHDGRWKSHLSLSNFLALVIGVAIYLAPLAYADLTRSGYEASGLWFAWKENVVRYFEPFDHAEPFYVYTYYLPAVAAPWIPLGLASMWCALRAWKSADWPGKWMTASCVTIFLFFTLSGSRRSYYILPILPFCAILMARLHEPSGLERLKRVAFRSQEALLAAFAAALLFSPALWPLVERQWGFVAPSKLVVTSSLVGVAVLAPLVYERLRPGRLTRLTGTEPGFACSIAMTAIFMGGVFGFMRPIFDEYRSTKPFSLELKELARGLAPEDIAFVEVGHSPGKTTSAEIVFYLDLPRPSPILYSEDELRRFLKEGGTKAVVACARCRPVVLDVLKRDPTLVEMIFPWKKKRDIERNLNSAWIVEDGPGM